MRHYAQGFEPLSQSSKLTKPSLAKKLPKSLVTEGEV